MTSYKFGKGYQVVCEWKKTRNGFKHEAVLLDNGYERCKTKVCYLNRTWEKFEYQTVINQTINHYFKDERQAKKYKKIIEKKAIGNIDKKFGMVKMVASIGNILCNSDQDKAAWKKKMIGTMPGINFPDDFDKLDVNERNKRLDNVIKEL